MRRILLCLERYRADCKKEGVRDMYNGIRFNLKKFLLAFMVGTFIALPGVTVSAQDSGQFGVSEVLLEKITVTARKREELIQNVPLSVTHFSSEEIEALKVRDLTSLSVKMPNVALDDIGTARGISNFSIRGLGVNSSIPSVDPTVGVFVDGVYMGMNSSALVDTVDIESIEVLRGPQGVLFGRNVTGGAILINTKKPGDEFEASVSSSIEVGGESPNIYSTAIVGGPLGDTVGVRLVAYTNQDRGWFENLHTGKAFGEEDTRIFRPVLTWDPTDDLSMVFRYEYQENDGDGPAAQSHTNGFGLTNPLADFDRDSHDFSIDEEGFRKSKAHSFTAQMDWDVSLGDGTITNIFGWRSFEQSLLSDIDASPADLFNGYAWIDSEQWSNELRYTGSLTEMFYLTTGVYYLSNDIGYHERRDLLGDPINTLVGLGALPPSAHIIQNGGGDYEVETLGLFLSLDYHITDDLTLIAGGRYTKEEKEAEITSLIRNASTPTAPKAPCNIVDGPDCPVDFSDKESWDSWSPKVGFIYYVNDSATFYSHWTRGFRSGGYNLRNSSLTESPGPYGEEKVDSFEAGFKIFEDRGRLNTAVFYNLVDDLQRELNLPDEGAGVVQLIRNTADMEVFGFEVDGAFALTEKLLLMGSLGYVDPRYTEVKYDLNYDGKVDDKDEDLEPPRAAKWTYSVGVTHDSEVGGWGRITSHVNYAHRDKSYFSDDNLGYISEQNILDAGIDFRPNNGGFSIGIYAKNLLDEVRHGGDTQLPAQLGQAPLASVLGGTFSPLAKGRIFGFQLSYGI